MRPGKPDTTIARKLLATAISTLFAPLVFALPLAPTVTNGNASFVQNGNLLTVTNSNGTIINWKAFSIDGDETVRFVQTSSSSSVLNRVLGGDPSRLLGSLQSNGRVFLINPAGILVGQGARIDVAGFIASTLNLSDADFLANRLRFTETPGAGKVQNFGEITTPSGGNVYLVAPQLENHGIITAPNGEVLLAAGQRVELFDTATPGVRVEIVGSAGSATNLGTITAEAGRIGIAGVLARNSGTLNASSLVSAGGRIFLKATTDTVVDGNSRISASGSTGGRIEVLGQDLTVTDHAQLDASGRSAGGTVLVGGDYQGKNASVQNAESTTFGKDAILRADATDSGNGGKVIVWADDTTSAYGNISARGGANGGDGGFVEVSGKQQLIYRALTDTRAPLGKTGTLLLDPTAIGLIAGAGTDVISTTATLFGDNITTNLGLSNVILQTSGGGTGNITFTAGTYNFSSAAAANSLTLLAFSDGGASTGNISLPSGTFITMKPGAPLKMVAGWDGASITIPAVLTGFGNISMVGSSISAPAGVTLLAGNNIDFLNSSSVSTSVGDMKIKTGGSVTLTGSTLSSSGTSQSIEAVTGSVQVLANASAPAAIAYYGSGAQTVKGASISLLADTTASSNKGAQISSSLSGSTQTVQATAGGITVTAGNLGTNNTANITAKTAQVVTATGAIAISAGTGGTSNSAGISSDGTQSVTAGSIALTGGGGTGFGQAQIKAMGAQTVTTTSGNIALNGGSVSKDNQASIDSDTSQIINVFGNMTLLGGTAGGAFIGGPTQAISIGGTLTMTGGSGATLDAYGMAAPAAIGNESGANVTLNAGGSVSLSGSSAINPAIIGAATGTASVYLRGTDINLGAYSFIGNWGGLTTGTATLVATSGAIQQLLPTSGIRSGTLTATSVGNIALDGVNRVDSVDLATTSGAVSYHTANPNSTRVGVNATGNISVTGDAGSTSIQLVELRTTGTSNVTVAAQGQILEGDWAGNSDIGVADVVTGSGNITLSSVLGTPVAGTLAISADVETTGTVSASVAGGPYGSIGIRDVGGTSARVVNINASAAFATGEGDVAYFRKGNLNLMGGVSTLTPKASASATIGASGNIAVSDNLTLGGATNTVNSGGTLSIASGKTITAGAGTLNVTAGSLVLSGTLSGYGDTKIHTFGTLDIAGGGSLLSTSGNLDFIADGQMNVIGGVSAAQGIIGDARGGLTLGAAAGGSGVISANNGVLDLAIGGSGIALYNGSYLNSTDATQPAGGLIEIFFPGMPAGGSLIDGVATFNGGYKVGGALTTLGTGLDVTYGMPSSPVSDAPVGDIKDPTGSVSGNGQTSNSVSDTLAGATNSTADSAGGTSQSSGSLALVDIATAGGSDATPTAGGGTGSFGSEEPPAGSSGASKDNSQDGKNAKKKPAQCSA